MMPGFGAITAMRAIAGVFSPPAELADIVGGPVSTKPGLSGEAESMFVTYEAVAWLKDPPVDLLPGLRGKAKITLHSCSLGSRWLKWLRSTINFQ